MEGILLLEKVIEGVLLVDKVMVGSEEK